MFRSKERENVLCRSLKAAISSGKELINVFLIMFDSRRILQLHYLLKNSAKRLFQITVRIIDGLAV